MQPERKVDHLHCSDSAVLRQAAFSVLSRESPALSAVLMDSWLGPVEGDH
jgi:hypothetical protein